MTMRIWIGITFSLLAVLLAGCDAGTAHDNPAQGVWKVEESTTEHYIVITNTHYIDYAFNRNLGCFMKGSLEILERDHDTFTIGITRRVVQDDGTTKEVTITSEVAISLDGPEILLTFDNGSEVTGNLSNLSEQEIAPICDINQ